MLWRGHYSYCVQGLGRSWMSVSYNVPRFIKVSPVGIGDEEACCYEK